MSARDAVALAYLSAVGITIAVLLVARRIRRRKNDELLRDELLAMTHEARLRGWISYGPDHDKLPHRQLDRREDC